MWKQLGSRLAPLVVIAVVLADARPGFAQQTSPTLEETLSRIPVQEGESPLSIFVPRNPVTSEEKLQAEALAWFMTAQLHYSRGETTEGLAALKKTVEKDAKSLTPYKALVPALLDARDLAGARKYALQGAALKADGILLVQGVSLALARLKQLDDAIALLKEALPLASNSEAYGRRLSLQRQMGAFHRVAGRHAEAAEIYKAVFESLQSPDNKLTPEQMKELLGDAGQLYDEFGQVFLQASQPELALKAFDEAAKYRPSRPAIHSFNLALLFRETKKPEQALAELDKYFAAQLQTKGRAAYQLLKDILADLQRDSDLIPRLEKLHELDAQNAPLAYFLGDQYLAAKRYDEALKTYTSAPGGSRDPRALVGLIAIYRHQKNIPELLSALPRAYQVVPKLTETSSTVDPEVSDLALRFQSEQEAITGDEPLMTALVEHARKLQATEKLEFVPAYFIGRLCIEADRTDDALSFYRYAISMQNQPPAQLFHEIALHLIQSDKLKPAIAILQEAVQHPSLEDARPVFSMMQVYALELDGQTNRALEVIQQARREFPRVLEIPEREAWVYYHSQQWDKAIAAYEALLTAAPSLGADARQLNTYRFSLSAIYVHLENFDKGEKILEDVLAQEPDNTQANNDLGYLWADRNKNLDRARKMIEKALSAEPDNAAYLDSMGWVEYRLGNYAEAKTHLEKATKIPERQDSTIWDHLGDVYDKLGKKDQAIKAWVRALEIELAKPKPDEKLKESLLKKVPADKVPAKKS
jgi:tetratricopeptide (TPR) repeat protein